MNYSSENLKDLEDIIKNAKTILIIQADNPDGDSLASSLALEAILHQNGKEPVMYCGVTMPKYLRYLKGWDRVVNEVPAKFDASIIVDNSSLSLLENIQKQNALGWVSAKPSIVLDHHSAVNDPIDFANVVINESSLSSTGELIYRLCEKLGWAVDEQTGTYLLSSILSDTQGLTNDLTSIGTYEVVLALIKLGVDRPKLEQQRRELSKMPYDIFKFKGELIERTKLSLDGKMATVIISKDEIFEYSPRYNPIPLVQSDMLQIEGVGVTIVFKDYGGKKITAAIRCSAGYPIANKISEAFGKGGHDHASGLKVEDGRDVIDLEKECISIAQTLISELE